MNLEHADVEISVNKKLKSFWLTNFEHADDEISAVQKVNSLGSKKSPRRRFIRQ